MSASGRWGDHHIICDRSGFKILRSEAKMEWNGLLVRKDLWEKRHSQDLVKPKYDSQSVRDARPETPDVFLSNWGFGYNFGLQFGEGE